MKYTELCVRGLSTWQCGKGRKLILFSSKMKFHLKQGHFSSPTGFKPSYLYNGIQVTLLLFSVPSRTYLLSDLLINHGYLLLAPIYFCVLTLEFVIRASWEIFRLIVEGAVTRWNEIGMYTAFLFDFSKCIKMLPWYLH